MVVEDTLVHRMSLVNFVLQTTKPDDVTTKTSYSVTSCIADNIKFVEVALTR